jgi:hypothetical protein
MRGLPTDWSGSQPRSLTSRYKYLTEARSTNVRDGIEAEMGAYFALAHTSQPAQSGLSDRARPGTVRFDI